MYLKGENGKKLYSKNSQELQLKDKSEFDKTSLSEYAKAIKKPKDILLESREKLKVETDPIEIKILLVDVKEAKSDLKNYDLSREHETATEYNAREKQAFIDRISGEPFSEQFIRELNEDHPEIIDIFNKLLNFLHTGYFLTYSSTPIDRTTCFNIQNETDLAIAVNNYNPETEHFYFNPKLIRIEHPVREGQSLIGLKFDSEHYEKVSDAIESETKKTMYPIVKSDTEAEKLFGKNYEYEIYFLEEEIGTEDYNNLNLKTVSYIEKDGFITVFMFIKNINLDTVISRSSEDMGFNVIYDDAINITEITGNILNTIDMPANILYSVASIKKDEELNLTISSNRVIDFVVRNKRPILASGKEDLAVAIDRNLVEMREYGKELPFPYHYNRPGVGIVYPNVINDIVRLEKVSRNKLTLDLAKIIDWRKNANEFSLREYPPAKQVDIMAEMDNPPYLPICSKVVLIPYIDYDGIVHYTDGYDEKNQLLQFNLNNLPFRKVSEYPSLDEINRAKSNIREPFSEFPLDSDTDFTNLVSLILTPFVSSIIPDALRPMFAVTAHDAGNGKTLLAECAAKIYSNNIIKTTMAYDDAEMSRKLLSIFIDSPDTIELDNINTLDSEPLAMAVTSTSFSERLLRSSKSITVKNNSTIIITGNNPKLSKELVRRTVFINLNAKMENPEYGRKFKISNLARYIEKNRIDLIWSCLTLIKAWICAGKPKDKNFIPMGSFEEWSTTVAGILANAGYKSFLENRIKNREMVDTVSDAWRMLIKEVVEKYGEQKITTAHIFELAKDIEGIDLAGKNSTDKKKSLGTALAKNCGRVYGDNQIIKAGMIHGSVVWQIIKIDSF